MKHLALSALVVLSTASLAVDAAGDAAAGQAKAAVCAACHGVDGNSPDPQWPKLAGQHAKYLAKQLYDFKKGDERNNAIMMGMSAGLSDQDIQDLSAYYSNQAPTGGFASEDQVERGAKIFRGGIAERGVPACMSCHGPTGKGDPRAGIPVLAGQFPAYTAAQLKQFRSGDRQNDTASMMRGTAQWLTDSDITAVAEYIAGLH